jgi:hypothetical protein
MMGAGESRMSKRTLRIPLALAFVTVSASSAAVLTASCGSSSSPPPSVDAATSCEVYCVPSGDNGSNCPYPTCATGSGHDQCPTGCFPEPIA